MEHEVLNLTILKKFFLNFMIFWLERIMLMEFQVKHFLKLQKQQ